MRFDTGSVPVGYLVLSSETRSIGEIQDLALFRVRPMFASLPGVSAPPPFGGNQRTVVVTVDPRAAAGLRHDARTTSSNALAQGNAISPSGNLPLDGKYPFVPVNSVVRDVQRSGNDPAANRPQGPPSTSSDVGYVQDTTDVPTGYALVNGRRSVYILVTKRADASTAERGQRGEGRAARHAGRAARRTFTSATSSTSRPTSPGRSGAWPAKGRWGPCWSG